MELEILTDEVDACGTLDIVCEVLDNSDGLHLSEAVVVSDEFEWVVVVVDVVSFYDYVEGVVLVEVLCFGFNEVLDIG